jgi:exoribonuclease-2
MLSPEALDLFALNSALFDGLSPALSFKIKLKQDLNIDETELFPSLIRVNCLSYEEADALIAGDRGSSAESGVLAVLAELAERNVDRRLDTGAIILELPEVHIHAEPGRIFIKPLSSYRSADMVRECMIWAGEAAARWAMQRQLPFPYISQEAGELPNRRLEGLAGAWQLRRCMRPRLLTVKPSVHWGLGLDQYTQVTSPLRRYVDLLCHQQIRAYIQGRQVLREEEILLRAAAADAAAVAVNRAEKASRAHWIAAYLSDKKDSVWDGVVLDRKENKGTVMIPNLGLETQVSLRGKEEPNDQVRLSLLAVKIHEGEAVFTLS